MSSDFDINFSSDFTGVVTPTPAVVPFTPGPTLPQFILWVRNVMGVPAAMLPDTDLLLQHTFDQSRSIVNEDLQCTGSYPTSFSPYMLAVFNLGGHFLTEFAGDRTFTVSAARWNAGYVYITTALPHSFSPDDTVIVRGISPSGYNGIFAVSSILSPTDFAYARLPTLNASNEYLVGVPALGPAQNITGATVAHTFWAQLRKKLGVNAFTPGLVSSAGDQGTSASLVTPEFMKRLTIFDLQLAKTPWGRTYMGIAQKYGPWAWVLA